MKHIISNPHNGAEINHLDVNLKPGYEVAVRPLVGEELAARFGFLLLRIVPGAVAKNGLKPSKIKGALAFNTEVHPDPDVADFTQHTHTPARVAASKKAAKKSKKAGK